MAEQYALRECQEEHLRHTALAVGDVLRQLQDARNNMTTTGLVSSRGRGRGGYSRQRSTDVSPQQSPGYYNRSRSLDMGPQQSPEECNGSRIQDMSRQRGRGGYSRGRSPDISRQQSRSPYNGDKSPKMGRQQGRGTYNSERSPKMGRQQGRMGYNRGRSPDVGHQPSRGGYNRGRSPDMSHQQVRVGYSVDKSPKLSRQQSRGGYNRGRSLDVDSQQSSGFYNRSRSLDMGSQEDREGYNRDNSPGIGCPQDETGYHRGRGRSLRLRGRGQIVNGALGDHREFYEATRQQQRSGGRHDHSRYSPHGVAGQVTPRLLVECLTDYPAFSASFSQLMKERSLHPPMVREVALSYKHIFYLKGDVLKLRPQLNMCKAHSGPQGCRKRSSCGGLHICPNYVLNWCRNNDCVLGHRWHTDHNLSILKPLFLEYIRFTQLRKLVRYLTEQHSGDLGQLDICREYNDGHCNRTTCDGLHVCLNFVIGNAKCSRSDCKLNHDLLSPDCCNLLKAHGLPTNETPRDTVTSLLATNPALAQAKYAEKNIKRVSKKDESSESAENYKAKKSPGAVKQKRRTKKKKDGSSRSDTSSVRNKKESDSTDEEHQATKENRTASKEKSKRGKLSHSSSEGTPPPYVFDYDSSS